MKDSPLQIQISFNKLLEVYDNQQHSDVDFLADKARNILKVAATVPQLREGFEDFSLVKKYEKEIEIVLQDAFSNVLTKNEIKAATAPFENLFFNTSKRFDTIIKNAGDNYELQIRNMPEGHLYILGCSVILKIHYGVDMDFRRPLFFDIPDQKGLFRHYRIMYNADYIDIAPTDKAVEVTDEDIKLLMDSFDNLELWKEKFPPESWICKGFIISNMFDVTVDNSISELKSNLLALNTDKDSKTNFSDSFEAIFQSIYDSKNVKVGFSAYDEFSHKFEHVPKKEINSYLLYQNEEIYCKEALCPSSFKTLFDNKTYFSVADIEKYYKLSGGVAPYKNLYEQGYRSAILAPILNKDKLLGILELVSTKPFELHSVNANKLEDVMPYLVTSILRSISEEMNQIAAIIQHECTSIHESVYWKFEKEAKNFLRAQQRGDQPVFDEIVFKDVFPLYGQIDIRNSSVARNESIQKDLLIQLNLVSDIFVMAGKQESLPIYDEINFRIKNYLTDLRESIETSSEQKIIDFLVEEIHPVLDHLNEQGTELTALISSYYSHLNNDKAVYKYRKDYDDTVNNINKKLASIIDKKQQEAQAMFPHYFERYKTDGIEHNMYIGASIAQNKKYSPIYLQNLRLWQLRTMCEMENTFYNMQSELPVKLGVASLIFVHSDTLSVRFRMDERQFDVDGTYNARYEVVKKRIDKAFIAGSRERITKEGMIAIVYSSKKHEKEYLRYVELLHAQNIVSKEVEIHEVEPLQGVSGLKVMLVKVLYTHKNEGEQKYYTYKDLLEVINTY
ncbi:GAF domain-containing protein [Ascidiimonas sp. W6]|uniref:GAF domain-containing protein n=1 Tax=Ascidiimonas meishanensis TaxID=3128903 RepID=UPI0030ED879E